MYFKYRHAGCIFSGKIASPPLIAFEAGNGFVRVHLKSETVVDFRMYSLSGRRVYDASEKRSAGEHAYRIAAEGLSPGAYVAQVKAGGESMKWKVAAGK